MPLDFKDLVVIITGGGGGLGRAYAHMYAKGKAKVVINDVSQANADKVVAEVKKRKSGSSCTPAGSPRTRADLLPLACRPAVSRGSR